MIGAEVLIKCLLAEGVDLAFGYPGGAIMPVYDELYKYQNQLKHILTRHEQGAIHAAQGYARATGKVGVVFATSGPGATNIITGIADAQIDSTPLVCITGQVAKHLLGTDAFQETDIIGISTPVTKWNFQITEVEEIPEAIAKAFYIARSGRPGPVLIDIVKSAQFDQVAQFDYKKCTRMRSYNPVPEIDDSKLAEAAQIINQAQKPYVVFGQGIILGQAENELKSFLEKTDIPAAATILGLSALPTEHPNYVGMVGMHGNYAPNVMTNTCDVLIALGMRFDDRVTGDLSRYAKQAKVLHFDIDPAEINKNVKADVAILGNVKEALQKILPLVEQKKHTTWREEFKKYDKEEYDSVIKNELYPEKEGLTMGEVLELINKCSNHEAVIVSDVGQHQMMACRYAKFKNSRSKITSGGLGTMGFALPAAIGAKIGVPEKQVVAVIGDGGFQMTIQELGTIFQSQIPVKIVVLNNEFLGMVRQWQELFFDRRYASTEMINPDFIKIAEGYHIQSRLVSKRSDLEDAVKEMLNFDKAYFLEIRVEKENNVFPMVPTGASVSEVRLK
ncbi:acetolactate synthase III, large subunit [Capnocytophaga canimorsus]|uniref:Acetolactate synthase n=1 Tax=Capnocytophaga canimorsus TaxID=28188 RepID=A0A0B7HPQ2_9FLAO|nr:biosynthetic-type acetolactate synthase large subunit [Capnocytophaga canimorsus]ATA77862.1 acetolactate synthase, large subunit, biosynthetic type [Capnocytophaga canimorsus]PJI79757.1 acetolactate synthase large subunit [Capnocytophaga canimorsus]CEN39877.1 acetolactate synthase III, large subunit [Capnocytophaga canimorsus]STA73157.1 Acetolactate synthase large subunit [Capnocytophaga canimorsus]